MSTPLEAKRLTVKASSALLVDANGEIRTSWLDSLAADLLSRRRRGQESIVATSGAIALGRRLPRHPLRPEEKKAAAGRIQISLACPEVAEKDEGVRRDQCHPVAAGGVRDLRIALEWPARAIAGVARSVIERAQREAAIVRTVCGLDTAAAALPA